MKKEDIPKEYPLGWSSAHCEVCGYRAMGYFHKLNETMVAHKKGFHNARVGKWKLPNRVRALKVEADLFLENGEPASLYDICQFIIERYPDDIFLREPKEIIAFRQIAEYILSKKVKIEKLHKIIGMD